MKKKEREKKSVKKKEVQGIISRIKKEHSDGEKI